MKPSDLPVSRTPVPLSAIARRAARTRSTARLSSKSGSAESLVESSIESPAMPVAVAAVTFRATSAGSVAKPPSKSALTGTGTAAATARRCARASSRVTWLSRLPTDQANPALVVASAGKPSWTSTRALPTAQGLGMTKHPDWCSRRNSSWASGIQGPDRSRRKVRPRWRRGNGRRELAAVPAAGWLRGLDEPARCRVTMDIPQDFAGRVAIVTCAARGLGRAAAQRLLERGASVAVNVRDAARAEQVTVELGGRSVALPGDVAADGVPEALVSRTLDRLGRVDILVNNAALPLTTRFERITPEEGRRAMGGNLTAPLLLPRAALPAR